jgi:hypothetical protein
VLKEIYIKRVSLFTTYFLAVLSLYEIGNKVFSLTSSLILSLVLIITILLIISSPFLIRYIYSPLVCGVFKIPPPDSFIITHSHHEVTINGNGDAVIICTREMVFLKKPQKWELVDFIFTHRGLPKEHFEWKSEDAGEISRAWIGKDLLAIFWRRKDSNDLKLNTPYTHKYSWGLKGYYGDPVNHWFVFPTANTGKYSLTLKTEKEIEKAIGFNLPWKKYNLLSKRQIALYAYARKIRETCCPQPEIHGSRLQLSWMLEELDTKGIFTCVFYHKGAYSWIDKLLK